MAAGWLDGQIAADWGGQIGRAIARRLGQDGALSSSRARCGPLDATAEAIRADGGEARSFSARFDDGGGVADGGCRTYRQTGRRWRTTPRSRR